MIDQAGSRSQHQGTGGTSSLVRGTNPFHARNRGPISSLIAWQSRNLFYVFISMGPLTLYMKFLATLRCRPDYLVRTFHWVWLLSTATSLYYYGLTNHIVPSNHKVEENIQRGGSILLVKLERLPNTVMIYK